MQQPIDRELLKKYLKDTCTPSELERVRAYLLMPGTQRILHELITTESEADWNKATDAPALLDEQMRGWQFKFDLRKTSIDTAAGIPPAPGFFKRNNFLKYAAVLTTVVLGIGVYTLGRLKGDPATIAGATAKVIMKEFSTVKGQRATVTLADGTRIYMGAASTLKYPEQFKDSIRRVSLQGEAFFEVAHNPRKPFIIETHHIRTHVLGTSFKVNAIRGRPFEVQVATGKVRVDRINSGSTEHLAVLMPGEQVSLNTLNSLAVSGKVLVEDIQGWKKSKLVFKDQSISEIAQQLERAYDVQFHFKNAAKAREVVTVTLQDNIPLSQTLQVLSAGAGFEYSIKGKNITIN